MQQLSAGQLIPNLCWLRKRSIYVVRQAVRLDRWSDIWRVVKSQQKRRCLHSAINRVGVEGRIRGDSFNAGSNPAAAVLNAWLNRRRQKTWQTKTLRMNQARWTPPVQAIVLMLSGTTTNTRILQRIPAATIAVVKDLALSELTGIVTTA